MIDFDDFSFWYPGSAAPTLRSVNLHVPEGELALVTGHTGSGKSTLLRAVNGLVPHFTGGHVEGRVEAAGRDPRDFPPREFADAVGVVGQDPLAGFVTDTVEEELAYGMEQLAVPAQVMRRRVEEVLDLMGIARLRYRALRTLSGGEQQRVALGAVLTSSPRTLVLDEPTSALDPAAAEDALSAVLRLVHDLGVTVLAAEHRLERIVEYADRLVYAADSRVIDGSPAELLRHAVLAPPVVELGRLAGWDPLPLSVRDARRFCGPLRAELADRPPVGSGVVPGDPRDGLVARGVAVAYGTAVAVRHIDLDVAPGEVVALMGRNGSGKSSLLWALSGALRRSRGTVTVSGRDPAELPPQQAAGRIALVPQQATDLLYCDSVAAECQVADASAGHSPGATRELFDSLLGSRSVADSAHPRDLSDGQRLALALAVPLVAQPRVVLLDEPTRGLDYAAKRRLSATLADLAGRGTAVGVATHDVEFVAATASRVVVLAEGEVITDAPTAAAVAASPVFAPQVAKVLAPVPVLTVDQVQAALGATPVRAVARG
jgi:energy-coupling factor transport system ATP-binding protein